jgi:hypothetical protein
MVAEIVSNAKDSYVKYSITTVEHITKLKLHHRSGNKIRTVVQMFALKHVQYPWETLENNADIF